jgi:hypothetical protein
MDTSQLITRIASSQGYADNRSAGFSSISISFTSPVIITKTGFSAFRIIFTPSIDYQISFHFIARHYRPTFSPPLLMPPLAGFDAAIE